MSRVCGTPLAFFSAIRITRGALALLATPGCVVRRLRREDGGAAIVPQESDLWGA